MNIISNKQKKLLDNLISINSLLEAIAKSEKLKEDSKKWNERKMKKYRI